MKTKSQLWKQWFQFNKAQTKEVCHYAHEAHTNGPAVLFLVWYGPSKECPNGRWAWRVKTKSAMSEIAGDPDKPPFDWAAEVSG